MKKLLTLFGFFVLCFGAQADTLKLKLDLELSIGITKFQQQTNGIWYQEGFDHSLKLKSASYSAKIFSHPSANGWQVGVGYTYVGKAASEAVATASDANYDPIKKACVGPCWPLSHWYGAGTVQGVSLLARKNFESGWYVEGGLMASRATYSVNIPDWIACATCATQNVTATQPVKTLFDPTVAIGYRRGPWAASLSVVPTHMTDGSYAIFKGGSPILAISYIIPL